MQIPRVGQRWEFRLMSGHKTIKTIERIYWKQSKMNPKRKIAMIEFRHTPNARYIPNYSVRVFLQHRMARLLTSRASDGLESPAKNQISTAEVKSPAKKRKVTSRT